MSVSWTIAIDWDRNGDFSGANEDVTNRVMDARWFLGFEKPYGDVPDNSTLTLVLDNRDRLFSPDAATLVDATPNPFYGNLLPFRPVRIQSYDGSTTRTHWTGWIENIKPVTPLMY